MVFDDYAISIGTAIPIHFDYSLGELVISHCRKFQALLNSFEAIFNFGFVKKVDSPASESLLPCRARILCFSYFHIDRNNRWHRTEPRVFCILIWKISHPPWFQFLIKLFQLLFHFLFSTFPFDASEFLSQYFPAFSFQFPRSSNSLIGPNVSE